MNIRDLTTEELENAVVSLGEAKYRGRQIYEWLHKKMIISFDEATNIGKELKAKLSEKYDLSFPKIEKEYLSQIDDTKKYLIALHDNNVIESVLMKYKYGYSICISSQVGCKMGCRFCASTIGGLKRNLEPYEMLAQVYLIAKHNNIDISNIVVMGSGEPLMNYDNLIKFLQIINSKDGQNISLRNVTISTCGIVPNIKKLAEDDFQLTLALSLHAPNDEIRKKIMPIANKYSLAEIMPTMAQYFLKTGRRITFEYSLIKDINDSADNAKELVSLFDKYLLGKSIIFNVNLIPVNEVKENGFKRPDSISIKRFKEILEKSGIAVTIRRELGKDISGSCGQLRARLVS